MIKKMTFILALAALVAASNISPAFASHRTTVCGDNPPGGTTVETLSGVSVRQVLVPEGASCTLDNVTVERDVVVLEGGRLAVLGSTIGDDIRADEPASIRIDCRQPSGGTTCSDTSVIGDDVIIDGTTGVPVDPAFTANYICNGTVVGDDVEITESDTPWQIGGSPLCTQPVSGNDIRGDLEVDGNQAAVTIDRNKIGKDVEVDDNDAQVTITNNRIGDDLDCDDNNPDPTGANNSVQDNARDECAAFGFIGTPAAGGPA